MCAERSKASLEGGFVPRMTMAAGPWKGWRLANDLNLNGGDGVRMTWPRAASIAVVLIGLGACLARFESRMNEQQRQIDMLTRAVDKSNVTAAELSATVTELRIFLAHDPPSIDAKGRIKK